MVRALGDVRAVIAGVLDDVKAISTSPAVMAELLGDLQRAETQLAARLREHHTKHGGSLDDRFVGAQAVAFHGQVQLAISHVQKLVAGKTAKQADTAIRTGLKRTVSTMEGLEQRFTGVVAPLRLREAHELSRATNQAKGMWARQFPTSVDRYGSKMLDEFEDIMRAGLISGASMDDMIGALTGHGGPRGRVSLAATVTPAGVLRLREADAPEGLFVRNKYWAERLVRTEMLRAYNGARQAGLESVHGDHPGMKRKILAVLDNRTAADSRGVHGQIRGIKENFVDGAGRSYLYPPARPNDRETVIPWKDEWEDSADNLSDWEKVCIGEGDEETEQKLFKVMEGIAKGEDRPAKKTRVKSAPKPKPPMEQPIELTYAQKLEQDIRGRLLFTSSGSVDFQGMEVGYVLQHGSSHKAYTITRDGGHSVLGIFDTREGAGSALKAHWTNRAAVAASRIEKWSLDDYELAVAKQDLTKMRRLTRGLLHENGVFPRDALLSDEADMLEIRPDKEMQDADASHHFTGKMKMAQRTFDDAYNNMGNHLRVMVHEEVHGSTGYLGTGFYARHGAAVEEVSVELAARKIAAKAVGVAPNWGWGAYQGACNKIEDIISEEVFAVDPKHPHAVIGNKEFMADAGIEMRSVVGGSQKASEPDDLLDQFVHSLKIPHAAKAKIRARIKAEVTSP